MKAPRRRSRWPLTALGGLFLVQGLTKAFEPTGYMAALDKFHSGAHGDTFLAVPLASVALGWTAVELASGVAMLHGGLARAPSKGMTLAGVVLALGLSFAYLSLDVGALARGLPIDNATAFGAYLPHHLGWAAIASELCAIAALCWAGHDTLKWAAQWGRRVRARGRSAWDQTECGVWVKGRASAPGWAGPGLD